MKKKKWSFSIRQKVLTLSATVLLGSMLTYLALATSLFTSDKVAYIYDLNSSLTQTLAAQMQAALEGLADKLNDFGADVVVVSEDHGPERGKGAALLARAAKRLFEGERDLLGLEVFERSARAAQDGAAGPDAFKLRERFVDDERLRTGDLSGADLEQSRAAHPLPWPAVTSEGVVVENVSLPPGTALMRVAVSVERGRYVVSAVLRPDRLLRIVQPSDAYLAYVVDATGRVVVHPDPQKVISGEDLTGLALVREALGGKAERGALSYDKAPRGAKAEAGRAAAPLREGAYIGAFARIGTGQLTVLAETPRAEATRVSRELVRRSALFGAGILLVALAASVVFSRRLSQPLRKLDLATQRVARGDFGVMLPVMSSDEVGKLAEAFNRMTHELLDRDRRLEESQRQLVQSEKLAAIGEISAGITHEIKNPLTIIFGSAQLGAQATSLQEVREHFHAIEVQSKRAKAILDNLLKFTRQERAEYAPVDLNEVAQDAVVMLARQMQEQGIEVRTKLAATAPMVLGHANQLQQVLINFLLNAQQALEGRRGAVNVTTTQINARELGIEVQDTGTGMSPEILSQLFRPFFTTKPKGAGTGLGLSVSQSIVAQHGGRIEVDSKVGEGTTFRIILPAYDRAAAAARAEGHVLN